MMANGDIAFDIIARDRASAVFNRVGRSTDTASSRMAKFGKVAKIAALGAAAGAVVAGKALFDMGKAAIADQAAQAKLAKALQNNARATRSQVESVESWIAAQGRAKGVADDDLRPALASLVAVTHDVTKAQQLAGLAMDVSAGTGKSLQAVSLALAKAQNGNVGALGRLGIATKDATGKTLSFDAVTQKLAQTFQGQANVAANTTAGKFARLKLIFDETKESIGAKLIPVAERLATWFLTKGIPAIQRTSAWLREHLGPAFVAIGAFIQNRVIPAARQFNTWFVEKIAPGLQRAVRPVLAGIRDLFQQVSAKVEQNRPQLEKLRVAFMRVAEFVATKVMPVLGLLIRGGLKVVATNIGIIIDVVSRLVDAFDRVVSAVSRVKSALGSIKVPDIKIPGLSKLPGFANGVKNFRGGLAIVGERGPELVRLPRGSDVIPNPVARSVTAASSGASSQPLVVQVVLDSKVIWEGQRKLYRTSGGQMGIAS